MIKPTKNEGGGDFRFCHRFYENGVNNCVTKRRFVFAKDEMFIYKKKGKENKYFCCEACANSWTQDRVYDKQIKEVGGHDDRA